MGIFKRYMIIISEYLKHGDENIYIQNPFYLNYVLKRGINTLTYVFKLLLIYTKNLDIIYYNCQKAYVYYIEFIGQIGEDNHSFLQLNSKDASLFVYKKTIFDINSDVRNNYVSSDNENKIISQVDNLINIFNIILFKLLEENKLSHINSNMMNDLQGIMYKIVKFYVDQDFNKILPDDLNNKIQAITLFSTFSKKKNLLEALELFIRKFKKIKKINNQKLEKILMNQDPILDLSLVKYINHILSHISINEN